jgi:hypothetical protein
MTDTPTLPALSEEGCACQSCGLRYKLDVTVQDDIWEQIKPKGKPKGAGLLCGACIVARVEALDEFAVADIRWSSGTHEEIALRWLEAELPNVAPSMAPSKRNVRNLARLLEATERAAVEKAAKIAEQRRDEWAPEVKHDVNKCSLCALARHKSDEAGWIAAAIRKAQP